MLLTSTSFLKASFLFEEKNFCYNQIVQTKDRSYTACLLSGPTSKNYLLLPWAALEGRFTTIEKYHFIPNKLEMYIIAFDKY